MKYGNEMKIDLYIQLFSLLLLNLAFLNLNLPRYAK